MKRPAAHPVRPALLALHCAAVLLAEGASVRLEPSHVQLGRFPSNRPPSAELALVNDGDGPLGNVSVRTGCGCLAAVPEGNCVQPGGRLRIRVSMSPEKASGAFSHPIFVKAEGGGLLRATVAGEAVPLLTVRPSSVSDVGDVVCGSPFQAEFRLEAAEAASLGAVSSTRLDGEVARLSPTSFRVVLRGKAPGTPGRFHLSASVPVASPAGWNPVGLAVCGRAAAPPPGVSRNGFTEK